MYERVSTRGYWMNLATQAIVGRGAFVLFCCTLVVSLLAANGLTSIMTATAAQTSAGTQGTATPNTLTCGAINAVLDGYRERLTYDQYSLKGGDVDLYIKSLLGKEIIFSGTVNDVTGGTVFIYDESCKKRMSINGIPRDESILFNKGSSISGRGTVGVFSHGTIIRVNVERYEVER